jgi:hypothetical protein
MSLSTTDARISYEDESEDEEEYDSDSDSGSDSESEEEYDSDSEEKVPLQKKLAACDSLLSYKIFVMELKLVSGFELLKIFIEDPGFQRDLTKVAEMIVADKAYDSGTRLTTMELIHTYNLDRF